MNVFKSLTTSQRMGFIMLVLAVLLAITLLSVRSCNNSTAVVPENFKVLKVDSTSAVVESGQVKSGHKEGKRKSKKAERKSKSNAPARDMLNDHVPTD